MVYGKGGKMKYKITIYEGVLNDDYIVKGRKNYTLVYYTYRNCWANDEHKITGPDLEELLEEYEEATGRLKEDQSNLAGESGITTEDLAREIDYIE